MKKKKKPPRNYCQEMMSGKHPGPMRDKKSKRLTNKEGKEKSIWQKEVDESKS